MESTGNWEVGLSGISMPHSYLSVSSLEAMNKVELGTERIIIKSQYGSSQKTHYQLAFC